MFKPAGRIIQKEKQFDNTRKNTKKIAEYVQKQLEEDKLQDQLTFREYEDPFKGSK